MPLPHYGLVRLKHCKETVVDRIRWGKSFLFPIVFVVYLFEFISFSESFQPRVECLEQNGSLLTDPPGVKLRKADGSIDIYLRHAIGHHAHKDL